ncbi:MAG: hypothetical protein AAFQ94_30790 [Bacteroidota bacterium]
MNGIKEEIDLDDILREDRDGAIFLSCICEMMENVERKISFTNDFDELMQMKDHKMVIRKVLEQNLSLN